LLIFNETRLVDSKSYHFVIFFELGRNSYLNLKEHGAVRCNRPACCCGDTNELEVTC
jgi:hypothetical protein